MRSLLFAATLLGSFVLSACSTIRVSSDFDDTVNFRALTTWSWYTEHGQPGSDERGVMTLTSSRIGSAIQSELAARGYREVPQGGSFLVTFHTVLQQKIQSSAEPYGYGWHRGYGGAVAPEITTYDEGTLLVDFIDPKTKAMIWRGTATAVVDPQSSTESREETIQEAVKKIVAEFPPKKKQ